MCLWEKSLLLPSFDEDRFLFPIEILLKFSTSISAWTLISGIISKYNSRKILPGKDGALLTSDGEKMIEAILIEYFFSFYVKFIS